MNDDLISRQEVLNKLNKLDQQELYLPCHFKEYIIEEVPSVQQKTGHWIEEAGDLRCSGCEFLITDEYYLGKGVACPNCGARMKGE